MVPAAEAKAKTRLSSWRFGHIAARPITTHPHHVNCLPESGPHDGRLCSGHWQFRTKFWQLAIAVENDGEYVTRPLRPMNVVLALAKGSFALLLQS